MNAELIAYIEMTDGTKQPVFQEDSRQFILDDDERVYGDWYVEMEPERYEVPVIIGQYVPPFE